MRLLEMQWWEGLKERSLSRGGLAPRSPSRGLWLQQVKWAGGAKMYLLNHFLSIWKEEAGFPRGTKEAPLFLQRGLESRSPAG